MWVPGLGLRSTEALLAALAPPLSAEEGIYLQSLRQLSASLLGAPLAPASERCSTLYVRDRRMRPCAGMSGLTRMRFCERGDW